MATIAELYSEQVRRLSVMYPAIAEVCKHFDTFAGMDDALGYASASAKWVRGEKDPAPRAERAAQLWLEAKGKRRAEPQNPPAIATDVVTLMVVGPRQSADKVIKIAAMIGCEVVEI